MAWASPCFINVIVVVVVVVIAVQVVFAIKEFVKNHLGVNFIQSPPTTMADIHGDSDPSTPIIFILSVGMSRAVQVHYNNHAHTHCTHSSMLSPSVVGISASML